MYHMHTHSYTTISEFKKSPRDAINSAQKEPVAILSHNHPAAYLLGVSEFEQYLKLKEAVELKNRMESVAKGQVVSVEVNHLTDEPT